ncbi:unnamed protein product [Microthlaspi erraticum]|uniref:Uncharacterized protein n=1 Tax=Microthlaspi erraticum TaxID=1685480 RepID=A0A6D2K036_9BRAS|nr:unnamed protein product [Microthlaspi erraticum]
MLFQLPSTVLAGRRILPDFYLDSGHHLLFQILDCLIFCCIATVFSPVSSSAYSRLTEMFPLFLHQSASDLSSFAWFSNQPLLDGPVP